jgi:hypothetical protein
LIAMTSVETNTQAKMSVSASQAPKTLFSIRPPTPNTRPRIEIASME